MKISVIGCGYLGAVHAATLASMGHQVVGIDTDEAKVRQLSRGQSPFYEPGLDELLLHGTADGSLTFSSDFAAVADCEVNFLCVGTPQSKTGEGADLGYRWFARTRARPLFPFGFGLSYTSFSTSGLSVKGRSAAFTVTNTGERAGDDVAQLYLVDRAGKETRRLVGFQRVSLAPGASQQVNVTIDPRLLADWKDGGWSMPEGDYGFALGRNAEDVGPVVTVRMAARRWTD